MKSLLKEMPNNKTVVFLDFEGTQFSHEIIALGAIKCQVDDNLNIIDEDKDGIIVYIKPRNSVGHLIQSLTNISDSFLKNNGKSLDEALMMLKEYINQDFNDVTFVTFGSNDARMLIESMKRSHPINIELCHNILHNTFDFLAFISRYIRDDNNNVYSLVNYLNVFNVKQFGVSHDPLHDAIDLKNLYHSFLNNKEIVKKEYMKLLKNNKTFPEPIKYLLSKLEENNQVTKEEYETFINDFLA